MIGNPKVIIFIILVNFGKQEYHAKLYIFFTFTQSYSPGAFMVSQSTIHVLYLLFIEP